MAVRDTIEEARGTALWILREPIGVRTSRRLRHAPPRRIKSSTMNPATEPIMSVLGSGTGVPTGTAMSRVMNAPTPPAGPIVPISVAVPVARLMASNFDETSSGLTTGVSEA